MATRVTEQSRMPGTTPTLLDRVNLAIKLRQEERQEMEEAFTKAENKYNAKLNKLDFELETLRRVKEELTNRE